MLRTLERILSMHPLGHECRAVLQVVICEEDSPADISLVEFPAEFEV